MEFPYIVRRAKKDEWEEAMAVAWRTFMKFEADDYTEEGIQSFSDFISGERLRKMFLLGEYHLWVALDGDNIIGLISMRNRRHISLLFVEEKYHKKGVGTALMKELWTYLRANRETCCTVNGAPYAVGFYHRLGFEDRDKEQTEEGIRFTPMIKHLT